MTTTQLISTFKYYKGEAECPFEVNSNGDLWWHGEKQLFENCLSDASFFNRLVDTLNEAISDGSCSGVLVDETEPIERRAIIFYLDLWHGKNFPYDNLDIIFNY